MGNTRLGVTSGLLAYIFWGVLGIFWELLHAVPALDTLAYRIFSHHFSSIAFPK